MKVLGHDDISHDDKPIPPPNLLQNLEKKVTPPRCSEQRLTPVTTASDEVQIAIPVVTRQIPWHTGKSSVRKKVQQ
jgi:hypothetical protein